MKQNRVTSKSSTVRFLTIGYRLRIQNINRLLIPSVVRVSAQNNLKICKIRILVKVLKEEICEVTTKKTLDDRHFLQIVFEQTSVAV